MGSAGCPGVARRVVLWRANWLPLRVVCLSVVAIACASAGPAVADPGPPGKTAAVDVNLTGDLKISIASAKPAVKAGAGPKEAPKLVTCKTPDNAQLLADPEGSYLLVSYVDMRKAAYKLNGDRYSLPTDVRNCLGYLNAPSACGTAIKAGNYLRPNTPLVVYVAAPAAANVQVKTSATAKLIGPQIEPKAGPPGAKAFGAKPSCRIHRLVLQPRPPGVFTVTTELYDAAGNADKQTTQTLEILVEQEYAGAIRVGVGFITPFADRDSSGNIAGGTASYSVRDGLVYRDGWSPVDLELIAGYTQFLSKQRLTELGKFHMGLFAGLGLLKVSPGGGKVQALTSAYLGWEFAIGGFTFTPVVGVRRAIVLAHGLKVGDYVGSSTSITTTQFVPALGLTLGYTANALPIAASGL